MALQIRRLSSPHEYLACQDLQRAAWGLHDEAYVVPVSLMISVDHAGGLVLGAFDGVDLVGFAFGYLGRLGGQLVLYSQLVGVAPERQGAGTGRALKEAQRQWAAREGLTSICWSYDPLQAGNANLNLHVLHAVGLEFHTNFFGPRSDALGVGAESDRLIVRWRVDPERPPLIPRKVVPMLCRSNDEEIPQRATPSLADSPALSIAIPSNITRMRRENPGRAGAWQVSTREAFQEAFAAGYVCVEFARDGRAGHFGGSYILVRQDT